ncbi:unnamed protein product, partial [Rotaria sp. Silwood1]
SSAQWTETGLYDLCLTLVYESITTAFYEEGVDARSIVNELKIFGTAVHLLAYPSPCRWFKLNLIRSKNKIAKRLSPVDVNDMEHVFTSRLNDLANGIPKEDIGHMKTATL